MAGRQTATPTSSSTSGHVLGAVATILLTAAFSGPAVAQADYPSRPVQLIVPYGAGGIADVGMRIVADKLTGRLKQQFVVENRPGAGGIVAAKTGASAAPDGYTLLMTGNNNAISAALFKSLPYNILTEFASTSTTSFFDLLIVAKAGARLKSVQDIIVAARASPGKLNVGTINPGSTQNLAAELFRSTTDINVTIVTFRTSPDMATALLRGDVDVAFEFYAAIQGQVEDGKIVAVASTGPKRTAYLPAVPTVQEAGIKDYEVASWNGISVPAATPKSVVQVLSRAINEVLPDHDVQERSKKLGMEMRGSTPEEMSSRLRADIAKWSAVIEKAGIPKRD
ncbi:MAG: tripartite tricarboxylate transporter substrate binding protein [Hyphomicrobiales bacterium]|nr:tripartite tricarboxylate transporter substrate binding protein [Hyphomicrobiales bacterium]